MGPRRDHSVDRMPQFCGRLTYRLQLTHHTRSRGEVSIRDRSIDRSKDESRGLLPAPPRSIETISSPEIHGTPTFPTGRLVSTVRSSGGGSGSSSRMRRPSPHGPTEARLYAAAAAAAGAPAAAAEGRSSRSGRRRRASCAAVAASVMAAAAALCLGAGPAPALAYQLGAGRGGGQQQGGWGRRPLHVVCCVLWFVAVTRQPINSRDGVTDP